MQNPLPEKGIKTKKQDWTYGEIIGDSTELIAIQVALIDGDC